MKRRKRLDVETILLRIFNAIPSREAITLSQLAKKTDLEFPTVKRWIFLIELIQKNPKIRVAQTEQSKYVTVQKEL